MAPTGTKRTAPPSDFKRIKAKVGKRAPKPASYTDTSFQKTSLRLTTQEQQHQRGDGIRSSRGHSLTTLAQQLGHVTTSIRQSAARGILDIVSQKQDQSWQAHLALVLPAIGHCLVDTATSVRIIGLSIWQTVLDQTTETTLRPFWGVFIAFLSSALNSLDRLVRRDSRIVVESAASRLPGLVAPHAAKLLPALMRLTEDQSFQYHSQISSSLAAGTNESSKRNRNGRQVWLETLAAVLRSLEPRKNRASRNSNPQKNPAVWRFQGGNTSKNSLFISRPVSEVELSSMQHWWHPKSGLGENKVVSAAQTAQQLPDPVAIDVWTKLRDLLLEIFESKNNSETLSCWAMAMQALLSSNHGTSGWPDSLERLIVQIQGLLLSHDTAPALMDTWMLTLTRISQTLPKTVEVSRRSSWIPKVINFILHEDGDDEGDEGEDNDNSVKEEKNNFTRWVILEHLLDDASILQSKAGKKVVDFLIKNWDERNLALVPKLYKVASTNDRLSVLRHMMTLCVDSSKQRDESTIASLYEFILDQVRDPEAVPLGFLQTFQTIWINEIVAMYQFESTQRLALSLLISLTQDQKLPDEILTAMSLICAKSIKQTKPCISNAVVPLIQDFVFDMRRTLALPKYFAFLMEGTCVTAVLDDDDTLNEEALERVMSYLLASGIPNRKILSMLWPLWRSWLEAETTVPQRAALCFLTILAADDASHSFLFDNLKDDAQHTVLQACMRVVKQKEHTIPNSTWFQPLRCLLSTEHWMWGPLLETVAKDVSNADVILLGNVRQMLSDIPYSTMKEHALLPGIQAGVHKLEAEAQGGPLHTASRDLTDFVKGLSATLPSTTNEKSKH